MEMKPVLYMILQIHRSNNMEKIIACIGSGNMGCALMKAASKTTKNIYLTDNDIHKAESAEEELELNVVSSNIEAAEKADFVFLAVKPNVVRSVLEEIAPILQKRFDAENPACLVSMAAGISIDAINSALNINGQPIVRIMPNTPALVAEGVVVLSSSCVKEDDVETLTSMLSAAGIVDRVDESYIDAVTALSGSGPAFVYMFVEALADGGVEAGLPRDKALKYAAQTVLGSAAMIKETQLHPGELKDRVASPGGTTIAGIAALEKAAFRGTVMSAVKAAFDKAKKMS
jgi:pyrroline-5-carboxylate reductase